MDYAYYSNVGGRNINEDTASFVSVGNSLCALVADGLGGQGNGDVASQTAAGHISDAFLANPTSNPADIQRLFGDANAAVCAINQGKPNTMTTMVGLFCTPEGTTFAHVGDSRLYHFVNGKIIERTMDHSVPQMAVLLGEITEDQIRTHPDRNRILRAIGSTAELKTEIKPASMQEGLHTFLLCSDGFWEYVLESEMEVDLAKANNAEQWLSMLKKRRDSRAPADADNNTAVVVFLNDH